MQDKVGSRIPSAEEVTQLVADIRALSERVAPYTTTLSTEERAATIKMRTGGENIVAQVGALAQRHGIALPQVSVDGMTADLTLAQRLRPVASAVEQLNRLLNDTILEAQSECWWATTALYTALSRVAGAKPSLESELRPIVDFFATGRRKKEAAPAATESVTARSGSA
jgi:hypothetical protein